MPIFFAFQITNTGLLVNAFIVFIGFSFLASSVYIINDWFDRHDDALHPEKHTRPIASGKIKGLSAFILLSLLLLIGLFTSYLVSVEVFLLFSLYLLINIAYTIKLKHIAIIDVTVISLGFVIRLFVGAEACNIILSPWIIIMTFLLALFLSLAKRRDDVLIYIKTEKKVRKVIEGYNLNFLDSAIIMTGAITIVSYIIWSISTDVTQKLEVNYLYLSSVFVIIGILRYLSITLVEGKSGNPSYILQKDLFIQLSICGWVVFFIFILYFN